ncbi:MAG: hypothetical protein WBH85_18905 [Thermoanaerobaculia bacterium]
MNFLRLLPVVLSLLLLGAHFLRAGWLAMAGALVALAVLAPVPRPSMARIVQVVLFVGGFEWIRTLFMNIASRSDLGEPWMRMAVILGAVTLFTWGSLLVFRSPALRARYGLDEQAPADGEQETSTG